MTAAGRTRAPSARRSTPRSTRIGEGGLRGRGRGRAGDRQVAAARRARRAGGRGGVPRCSGPRASEFEADLPYALWTEALDPHLPSLGDRAISRLGLADPGSAGGRSCRRSASRSPVDRHRMHRALRDLLERAGRPRARSCSGSTTSTGPTPASVDALAALVRRPPGGAVLLALAARERRWPPALTAALAGADREDRVTALALAPLSEAEAAELVGRDARAIYRASGGNPFYLEQLARAARRARRASTRRRRRRVGARARSRPRWPPSSRSWRPRRGAARRRRRGRRPVRARRWRPRSPSCPSRPRSSALDELLGAHARAPGRRAAAVRVPPPGRPPRGLRGRARRLAARRPRARGRRARAARRRRRGAGAPRRARGAARRRARRSRCSRPPRASCTARRRPRRRASSRRRSRLLPGGASRAADADPRGAGRRAGAPRATRRRRARRCSTRWRTRRRRPSATR